MISGKQLTRLTAALIFSTAILYLPSISLKESGNGGWASPLLSMLIGIIVVIVIYQLHRDYPQKTFAEYLPQVVGNTGAKIFGILYVIFFWDSGLDVVREIMAVVHATLLPQTPLIMVCLTIVMAIAYGLHCGLESIARVMEYVSFSMIAIPIILVLGVMGSIHINAFFPMFDKGWLGVARGAFVPSSWYGEVLLMSFLLPFVVEQEKVLSSLFLGLMVTTVISIIITGLIIGVMGTGEAARTQFVTYEVMRYVQLGDFLQHIDALFLIPWLLLMLIKGILFFYVTAVSFAQTIGVSRHELVVLPLVLLSAVISHWFFRDEFIIGQFLEIVWPNYSLIFELVIPLMLLCVHLIRKGFSKGKVAS